jgi:hypothetical protein
VDVPSAAPHSPQNFSRDSFAAPHRGHFEASASPHSAQNFRPSRLSVPHFEQRIKPLLIEPCRVRWMLHACTCKVRDHLSLAQPERTLAKSVP